MTLDESVAEDHEKFAIVLGSGAREHADRARRVTIPMMNSVGSLSVTAVTVYATR